MLPRQLSTCLLAWSILTGFAAGAVAEPLSFSPDNDRSPSTLSCDVRLDSVGSLSLRSGVAIIRGNRINILSRPDDYLPAKTILTGFVVRVEADTVSKPAQVTGLAYFQSGESLRDLDDPHAVDLIFKHDGALSGRIAGIQGYDLRVIRLDGTTMPVDISTLKFIRSPRAFLFRIPINNSAEIPEAVAFNSDASSAVFKATVARRSLPLSSVLPAPPADGEGQPGTTADGRLTKYGEGSTNHGDMQLKSQDDDDPLVPVFKWSMPGIPRKRPYPYEPNGIGGI